MATISDPPSYPEDTAACKDSFSSTGLAPYTGGGGGGLAVCPLLNNPNKALIRNENNGDTWTADCNGACLNGNSVGSNGKRLSPSRISFPAGNFYCDEVRSGSVGFSTNTGGTKAYCDACGSQPGTGGPCSNNDNADFSALKSRQRRRGFSKRMRF